MVAHAMRSKQEVVELSKAYCSKQRVATTKRQRVHHEVIVVKFGVAWRARAVVRRGLGRGLCAGWWRQ